MSTTLMFWILMLLWLVMGLRVYVGEWSAHAGQPADWRIWGWSLLHFLLFLLLGSAVFGPPIK
jgi:hypothetical protein